LEHNGVLRVSSKVRKHGMVREIKILEANCYSII
jgi:hypothetical protein